VQLATSAEVTTGTDNSKAVTPAGLNSAGFVTLNTAQTIIGAKTFTNRVVGIAAVNSNELVVLSQLPTVIPHGFYEQFVGGIQSFTIPANVTTIYITACAGGGSGASNDGGGAGGGEFIINMPFTVTPGSTVTVSVGAGGAATAATTAGFIGNNTSFTIGGIQHNLNGGQAGKQTQNGAAAGGHGGISGSFAGGDGGQGHTGNYAVNGGNSVVAKGGIANTNGGGGASLGAGGNGSIGYQPGQAGVLGGGGSGGWSSYVSGAGGNGYFKAKW
jgi:hypothetical protein